MLRACGIVSHKLKYTWVDLSKCGQTGARPSLIRANQSTLSSPREIKSAFFTKQELEKKQGRRFVVAAVSSDKKMAEGPPQTRTGGIPKLMIASDLDNTMVDHHDNSNRSLLEFNKLWEEKYANDSLLVFSTGRSPTAFKELKSHKPLRTPDILILSVGTEILYGSELVPDKGWEAFLDEGWDRKQVVEIATKFSELKFQAESEQRPHKVSFHVDKEGATRITEELRNQFKSKNLKVKIIYSGGVDLDLLPEGAGKGKALAYLLSKLEEEGRKPTHTLVCGDSGNDAELFTVPTVQGVIVGNAMEELVHFYDQQSEKSHILRAKERCAGGILEAIKYFNL